MAYNKIILEGHLTRDIEIRYGQSGNAIANTGIAVSKKFKKKDGIQGEKTLFVDLTFYSRGAEIANQYLRKGSHILVDGELRLDQWDDKNGGGKRSKHSVDVKEMQMLGSKDENQSQTQPQNNQPQTYQAPQQNNYSQDTDSRGHPYSQPIPQTPTQDQQGTLLTINLDDEIPFAPLDGRLS